MEWTAEGLILASRPHGETSAIVDLLTQDHGRRSGIVRGGSGRKLAPILQPGGQIQASWRARLDGQLGHMTVEPIKSRAAHLLQDRKALAALSATCALLQRSLPDREPHPEVYLATQVLLDALIDVADWPALYLHWEAGLLTELGFGLDLSSCAVTGSTQGLVWVSPRSGRAVTAEAAKGWEDKLLALPMCLRLPGPATAEDLGAGLRLTGHFLHKGLCSDAGARPLPEARVRLVTLLSQN